jgi:predicted methyltransferase
MLSSEVDMGKDRVASRLFIPFLLMLCVVQAVVGVQNWAEQEKQREQWQRVTDIFDAMAVRRGARVADVGAADGFFTTRLAKAVGRAGHVYAVDISDTVLERLRRRLVEESIGNVTVIKGTSSDPLLPAAALDAALIINAYHEMPEHRAMLDAIRTALKPTGRLVIVEPISDARRAAARDEQTREHEIAPEFVLQETRAAGFRIIGLEDPFTSRGRELEWMVTVTPRGPTPTAATITSPTAAGSEPWQDPNLRISVAEFAKLTTTGAVTIIDVRDQEAFAKGHIPNAILIPVEQVETSAARLRGLKRPFVTYCS